MIIGRILKYSDFFKNNKPTNKIDLIIDIPKIELIATISAINHTIKPPRSLDFDNSIKNQIRLIELIYMVHSNSLNKRYCAPYIDRLSEIFQREKGGTTLFTRVSCLYGLNEVIFTDKIKNETIKNYKFTTLDIENIFKFLLLCNEELLAYNDNYDSEMSSEKLGDNFFEAFMFKELPHQQYYYTQNPVNLLQRAISLFSYIKQRYSTELNEFLKDYHLKSPEEFIGIIGKFLISEGNLSQMQIFKIPHTKKDTIARLNKLSKRGSGKPNTGIKKFEFLEIKKSPFYCYHGKNENIYILMDNVFFTEKGYDLFFWDFYFDQLNKNGVSLKKWGGFVGYFFEEHIKKILNYAFQNHKDIVLKCTNELLINGDEYADFYIRRKRQVIIGQAKRTFLPQVNYKEVYSLKDYQNINKEEFYDRFGLSQLVKTSIKKFDKYAHLVDSKLPNNKLFIYPVLLINEAIISQPITSFMFEKKFQELLKSEGIELDSNNIRIGKLTVIHINELENLQQSLKDGDFKLDNFLKGFADNRNPHLMKNNYASFLNFDNYIRKKVSGKAIPDYVKEDKNGFYHLMTDFLDLKKK